MYMHSIALGLAYTANNIRNNICKVSDLLIPPTHGSTLGIGRGDPGPPPPTGIRWPGETPSPRRLPIKCPACAYTLAYFCFEVVISPDSLYQRQEMA
jgi:hypothetical protein